MIELLRNVGTQLKNLLTHDAGQDLVEYGLLAMLIGVGALASIPPLASALAPLLNAVTTVL